jgi:hypothetical protein
VWGRLTGGNETQLGDGRRASSAGLTVPGGGAAGGGAATSFSAMMRLVKVGLYSSNAVDPGLHGPGLYSLNAVDP